MLQLVPTCVPPIFLCDISSDYRSDCFANVAGGVCAPAGKVPYRCGTAGDLVFVNSVALPPPPPGSTLSGGYSATHSMVSRFENNPPPPPSADKVCGRGP